MFSPTQARAEENPFASFLYNAKNMFPLAALGEIARNKPGGAYSPFTLCGPVSAGKSHLLQNLTEAFRKKMPPERIVCSKALRFCTDNTQWALRPEHFWRRYNVLLLDDMQELTDKPSEQRTLEILLDACPTAEKCCQAVFAYAGNSASLKLLEERLRSRLESGLVAELSAPDMDVRLRYAHAVCKKEHIPLDREQCLFLAQTCSQTRLLHGILLKIKAFISVHKKKISQTDIQNILSTGGLKKPTSCKKIIAGAAQVFGVRVEDILSDKRNSETTLARHAAMYLCRRKLRLPYADIGREFEGRDHSTVIYAFNRIKKIIVVNKDVHNKVSEVEKNLT
ncbi:MAG: chromosomal replication initiator DnaA [Desulfovibrio sp.]|jgi:chromosomal replication initiator protein|nr:chromosomal replication initiator DnaA [Desulfovibrio sp.]